jgi:hypothetical protein
MEYVSPLSYVWGTAAIFAFQTLSLPAGISKVITFLGARVFMVHWLDQFCAGYQGEMHGLMRIGERRFTPRSAFDSVMLISAQFVALGALLEIYRDRIFQFLFNTGMSLWSWLRTIGWPQNGVEEQWRRTPFIKLGNVPA